MLPDHLTARLKAIGACQSARAMLDYIEQELARIMMDRHGSKISRSGGGSIIVLDQEPGSPRSGPGSLILIIKVPQVPAAGPLQHTLHLHDDRAGGRGIAKAIIIATVLEWLEALPVHHVLGSLRLVFHEWHDGNMAAMDQFAAVLPVEHAFAWFMEPTGSLACPVEKGFGKLVISFSPGETSLPPDASARLAKDITGKFKPSHPVYPLDPANRLSFRFLPGAEWASANATGPRGDVHVAFSHRPLSETYKRDLVEYANNQGNRIGARNGVRVRTDYHFLGAKFCTRHAGSRRFVKLHEAVLGKEPYMDWHPQPSMASAVFKHHPGADGIIHGPGEPFLLDDAQAVVTARDVQDLHDLLEATGSEFLFRT